MHDTTVDLGEFGSDPRFTVTAENGRTEIRLRDGSASIVCRDENYRIWIHDGDDAEKDYLANVEDSAVAALAYLLGDPAEVGPVGMSGWLHTDGLEYLHDPATSGYKRADAIKVGDVIAYAGRPEVEILGLEHFTTDFFGRQMNGFWGRRLDTGQEGAVPFGPDGMFPVKFRN